MSPNMDQIPSQDSTSTRDPPPEDTFGDECKEEAPTPKPEHEQFDVKEEPESPDLGEAGTAQASQPPQERFSDPVHTIYYQDARSGPSEAPWTWAMNEPRCVQYDAQTLRCRTDGVEALSDIRELREGRVIGETLRECQVRLVQCTGGLVDLDNRMRTQDWCHDVSEHESSDENHQTADGRPRPRRAAPKLLLVTQAREP